MEYFCCLDYMRRLSLAPGTTKTLKIQKCFGLPRQLDSRKYLTTIWIKKVYLCITFYADGFSIYPPLQIVEEQ